MSADRLDQLALRLSVARDESRLRPDSGVIVRVIAGQLAELALAGVLIDYEGSPVVLGPADDELSSLQALLERVDELRGWRWDQLFWRQGIYGKAVLAAATAELIDTETWVQTAPARAWRPARYADIDGAGLQAAAGRLDGVIRSVDSPVADPQPSDAAPEPDVRDLILVALMALRFTREYAAWMDVGWVDDPLPELEPRVRTTVQQIVWAAGDIAAIMRTGGSKDPVASQGF
jgi:hypothetical protein